MWWLIAKRSSIWNILYIFNTLFQNFDDTTRFTSGGGIVFVTNARYGMLYLFKLHDI